MYKIWPLENGIEKKQKNNTFLSMTQWAVAETWSTLGGSLYLFIHLLHHAPPSPHLFAAPSLTHFLSIISTPELQIHRDGEVHMRNVGCPADDRWGSGTKESTVTASHCNSAALSHSGFCVANKNIAPVKRRPGFYRIERHGWGGFVCLCVSF